MHISLIATQKGDIMPQDDNFLPEKLQSTITIPKNWHPENSVKKISKLSSICKPAIEDIIVEFWIAHEKLVTKQIEGWTWGKYCKETGYNENTPYRWFEKYNMPITKTRDMSSVSKKLEIDKPLRIHTKPDDKIQLNEIKEKIQENSFSDDDLKDVSDTIAEKVTSGQSGIRVGSKMATAIKKQTKSKAQITPKEIDNFDRLRKHSNSHIEGLTFWADGTMKPENELEIGCAKSILAGAANCIIQYARLGIDVQGIYQTLIEGKGKSNNELKKENEPIELKQIN
jgi:hypothetical protein